MTTDKVTQVLEAATEAFRSEVSESYDIDSEVISALCEMFAKHAKGLTELAPKRARGVKTTEKKQRKKSGYNIFVREMMQDPEIVTVPHKEKMQAIAARWKELSDEDKQPYNATASSENEVSVTADPAEAEN